MLTGLHDIEIELLYKQRLANFVKRTSIHSSIQCYRILSVFLNLLLYSMCVCTAFGELKIYNIVMLKAYI